jgi:predicted permease
MARREKENDGCSASLASLRDWYVGPGSRRVLWVLLGAVGLLLLAACANVANLVLAQGSGRMRELMIRSAIGASRGRLTAQMFTESLVLAIVGGAAGLLLALWTKEALIALLPPGSVYGRSPVVIDWRVLLYTFALSIAAGLLFGLLPACRHSRAELNPSRVSTGATSFRLRATILMAQTALAVTLVAAAGLLARTFLHIWQIDRGFSSTGVQTAGIGLPRSYDEARRVTFYEQVLGDLAREPQIVAAGAVTWVPLGGGGSSNYITIEGREALSANPGSRPGADRLIVTPGYFPALDIALRDGRFFSDQDTSSSMPVVIVRFWPNESPIGRRIKRGTPTAPFPWMTVVGVVRDVRQHGLVVSPNPTFYIPHSQTPEPAMTLVVRSDASAATIGSRMRAAVRAVDPNQPIARMRSLDDVVFGALGGRWLPMLWMSVFAGLAICLAAVGVYGVVSYAVEQRRREFGIRMALGADRSDLIRLAVGHGLAPVVIGTLIGVAAAVMLARLNSTLLVGVTALDVPTYVAAAASIALIAFGASYAPARRVTTEDAALALRAE